MANALEDQEKQSKLLVVALEVLRRSLTDSISFSLANRTRQFREPPLPTKGQEGPWWSMAFEPTIPKAPSGQAPIKLTPTPTPNTGVYGVQEAPTTPIQADLPPIPLAPDKKPETVGFGPTIIPPIKGGFGLKPPSDTSTNPAYDRPIPVIVVGPKPLPVSFDKALMQRPDTPRSEREPAQVAQSQFWMRMIGRFAAVLGPLAVMQATMQSANSGVGVFQRSLSVLGAALAPVLLPPFMILSATILTVADLINSKLAPALGDFYELLLKMGLAKAESKVSNFSNDLDALSAAKNFLTKGELPKVSDMPKMADTFVRNIVPGADVFMNNLFGHEDAANFAARQFGFGNFSAAASTAGFAQSSSQQREDAARAAGDPMTSMRDKLMANMKLATQSLIHSVGPKAQYSGLGDVGKQATLALMNADPLEIKAAEMIIKSIEEFQRTIEQMGQRTPAQGQINRSGIIGAGMAAAGPGVNFLAGAMAGLRGSP